MTIAAMGYVGVSARDISAWQAFLEQTVGTETFHRNDSLLARIDSRDWRLWIDPGDEEDLAFIGWEACGEEAFLDVLERLKEMGCEAVVDKDLAALRGVVNIARFIDPAGVACELYWGATERFNSPLALPCGVSGYVTGEQGVGHLALNVPDPAAYLAFYRALGFGLSDFIDMPIGPEKLPLKFLHCNSRHHTLAFGTAPLKKKIIHFMLQAKTTDDVGLALDRARRNEVPITISMGRHSNDHMLSFYVLTPSGFEMEYGCGAREITPGWLPVRHDTISMWGHEMLIIPGLEQPS